jgi:hypothetical protein
MPDANDYALSGLGILSSKAVVTARPEGRNQQHRASPDDLDESASILLTKRHCPMSHQQRYFTKLTLMLFALAGTAFVNFTPARTQTTDWFGAPQPSTVGKHHIKNKPLLPAPYLENLPLSEVTLAEALKANGYNTFFAQKLAQRRESTITNPKPGGCGRAVRRKTGPRWWPCRVS